MNDYISIQVIVVALAAVFVYIFIKEGLNHKIYDWSLKNMLVLLFITCIISTIWYFLPAVRLPVIILASSGFSYLIICYIMNKKNNEENEPQIQINQEQQNLPRIDSKEPKTGEQLPEHNCQIIRQNKKYTKEEFVREVNNQNIVLSTSVLSRLKEKDNNNNL